VVLEVRRMLAQDSSNPLTYFLAIGLIGLLLFVVTVAILRWVFRIDLIVRWLEENNKELKQIHILSAKILLAERPKLDVQEPDRPPAKPAVVAEDTKPLQTQRPLWTVPRRLFTLPSKNVWSSSRHYAPAGTICRMGNTGAHAVSSLTRTVNAKDTAPPASHPRQLIIETRPPLALGVLCGKIGNLDSRFRGNDKAESV
jgi:hypothetical protein